MGNECKLWHDSALIDAFDKAMSKYKVCQSLVTPCTSYPCCSLGGTSGGETSTKPSAVMAHRNLATVIDGDIVKTAMGAAGRAISSMTTKASSNPKVNEEDKEKKDGEGEMNQNTSCETELTVLLNAWYSAGFTRENAGTLWSRVLIRKDSDRHSSSMWK